MAAKREEKRGGCLGRLVVVFVLVLLGGFATALWFVAQPQDLGEVSGYGVVGVGDGGRDLGKVLENALQRGHGLVLGEAEINGYLRRTLNARQGGQLAPWVTIEGVAVRLEAGWAEVVIERAVAGRPQTVSMFVSIEQSEGADGRVTTYLNRHGGPFLDRAPFLNRGGRFGRLVVPQGFLVLVLESFERLAKVYEREWRLAFEEMARIRIEANRLVLDPLPPAPAGTGSF
jgi:hypothetical protein